MNKNIKFTPIGGVAQIGSNMTLVETNDTRILIDAGILFPDNDFFGINYLIPDLSDIDHIDYLLITHAHEDHIGAIAHVLETLRPKEIWAPELAASLIKNKLKYFSRNKELSSQKIIVYNEDDTISCNSVTVNPIHVNHSIPQTYGLHFSYQENSFFFVSDFKIDLTEYCERGFNFDKLILLSSSAKKKFLFADSTNITSSHLQTPSEGSLKQPLSEIIKSAKGRVFVTSFSSNIHRMNTIIDICHKENKKLVFYGRSAINFSNTAIELGLLSQHQSIIKDVESISPEDIDLVVWASGCQGDFRGTFRRIALGDDKLFKPSANDTFVMSSSPIPGNEKNIFQMMNSLSMFGSKIFDHRNAHTHVSGHPGKDDLKSLYQRYNPDYLIPIHGEILFLRAHALHFENCNQHGKSILMTNYDQLQVSPSGDYQIKKVESLPPILIHGDGLSIERKAISERRKVADKGLIFISYYKNKVFLTSMGLPEIFSDSLPLLKELILDEISLNNKDKAEKVRILARQFSGNILGYRPIVQVHELD